MKYRWKFLMVIALSAVIFAVVIMTMPSWKGMVQTFLGKKGERPKKVKPIKESFRQVKILPVDRLVSHIVTNLDKALKARLFYPSRISEFTSSPGSLSTCL